MHLCNQSGELALANCAFISISSISGEDGVKTIYFPKNVTVTDPLSNEVLAENVDKLDLEMKNKETKILKINSLV